MTKKIVIVCPNEKVSNAWAKAIRKRDPDFQVEIYPKDTEREKTEFILSFLPENEAFSHYPNLKIVSSMGAGVYNITHNPSFPENVRVTKIVQQKHQQDMAEFVLGLILSHTRKLNLYASYQHKKKWKPESYRRAEEVTVGIMGFGAIGQVIGETLTKNGFTVTGWSRTKKNVKNATSFHGPEQRDLFLKTAQILVCVLPLTEETTRILNSDLFDQLPQGAYLINVGRGAQLVEEDLLEALNTGQLSGAALDVFQTEPLPENHPFWTHDKIKITPHTAGDTHPDDAVEDVLYNYEALKKNKALRHEIDLKKGY